MKMYEPKLSLGDSVWVMEDNKPVDKMVVEIEVMCRGNSQGNIDWFVKYTLTGNHTLIETTPNFPGDSIYKTKKELVDSL
jgi:hypothetical protein